MKEIKRLITVIIFVLLLTVGLIKTDVLSDIIDKTLTHTNEKTENGKATKEGEVIRIKDGDTYVLLLNGKETTVRLIGVDTPESVAPEESGKTNTEEGKQISEIVKETIKEGDIMTVSYDKELTDKYGRTLAYVYFSDGTMVQEWLLLNGYAKTMEIEPNTMYAEHFKELEETAKNNNVGLWNGFY